MLIEILIYQIQPKYVEVSHWWELGIEKLKDSKVSKVFGFGYLRLQDVLAIFCSLQLLYHDTTFLALRKSKLSNFKIIFYVYVLKNLIYTRPKNLSSGHFNIFFHENSHDSAPTCTLPTRLLEANCTSLSIVTISDMAHCSIISLDSYYVTQAVPQIIIHNFYRHVRNILKKNIFCVLFKNKLC
jgi:hypothetical protein